MDGRRFVEDPCGTRDYSSRTVPDLTCQPDTELFHSVSFKFPFKIPFLYNPDLLFWTVDIRIPFPGTFGIPAKGFRLTREADGFSPQAVH
ncbi:hypothetical protein llap_8226 [Limosa lapponica baueri]|uniref:Uncharacterized protein n=1 Tax=Limosa lapponica baueri TaxID=1758121 RepID=A0A2I0U5Y4_LIMLA|nr:hypothetical protein llap_8226 [Limosa lapponica baueri]